MYFVQMWETNERTKYVPGAIILTADSIPLRAWTFSYKRTRIIKKNIFKWVNYLILKQIKNEQWTKYLNVRARKIKGKIVEKGLFSSYIH